MWRHALCLPRLGNLEQPPRVLYETRSLPLTLAGVVDQLRCWDDA
jgi:hypothetical protein